MDPLAAAGFAVLCFVVALAGGIVGLVLGNLRLPAVLALASSPAAGAAANLGISAVAAATAAITHARGGRVNWRLFAWMAPPSIAGAVAGGLASGAVPDTVLVLSIAALLFWFGIDLLRRGVGAPAPTAPDGGAPETDLDLRAAAVSGGLIGALGGFVGLILGSLRMPALLRYVGEAPARAVGTNVTIGFCVGAAGVAGHLPSGVDAGLLGAGAAGSIPGAWAGSRLTGRLSDRDLVRAIGWVLIAAAAATAVGELA